MGTGWSLSSITTSWVDPVATLGAGTMTALVPDSVMTALSLGIARRYVGREVTVTLQGVPVTARLGSFRVRRQGAHFESRARLTGIDWGGHALEEVTAVANGVRLVPGAPTRVRTAQIDVAGRVALSTLLAQVNLQDGLDWTLFAEESGLIRAEHRHRRLTAVVDASIADDVLRIEVIRARWRGLPVPGRYLPAPVIPLPPLPNDARNVRATRDGHVVRFTLEIPMLSSSFDLTQLLRLIG
ncbi:hypothetical protein BTZ20_0030 [Rhodococcus sp. MTM3W5.2]|uniref:hypothetical protein n=1 Tax=Rhodococcus sp. MTM3W5.2 TaxID=1805827 RepID=UPI0009793312|nr:hypothetical protein [Rhodococcus sp. MTM3W5.2]AQA24549.1 hypothetical protein BTZ20_0030 [Rhodococcus sp. MTM3W5.2]